jgi:hypothetical protein
VDFEPQEAAVQALCKHHREADASTLIIRLCRQLLAQSPTQSGSTPLRVLGSIRCIRDVRYAPLAQGSQCSGLLISENGGYVVVLDERESPGRAHRSLAHEIVHTYFREVEAGPSGAQQERLCEIGATELVMPEDRVAAIMRARPELTFYFIAERASDFNVSRDAAARRLVELSQTPVCYLVATIRRTKAEDLEDRGSPILRVASWTCSSSWPERRPYLGLGIDPDSLLAQAFTAQDSRTGQGDPRIRHRNGAFMIEAAGYEFVSRENLHRQVAVLLRA